jgi:hypothetical protein
MTRLADLIIRAKTGKPVAEMLGLDRAEQGCMAGASMDEMLDQITLLEEAFFSLADKTRNPCIKSIISDLEKIASDLEKIASDLEKTDSSL